MFHNCSNVQISGGVFTVLSDESESSDPPIARRALAHDPGFSRDFRSIRLCDLNLLSEIGKQEIVEYHEVRRRKTGALVRRDRDVVGTRRIYQARVLGRQEILTAVIYQGIDIEKWTTEAKKHETFRHPSLVQLYGVTVSRAINALIYTDALISLRDVREFHENSPLGSTYVEWGIKRDLYVYFSSLHLASNLIICRPLLNTGKKSRERHSYPLGPPITLHGSVYRPVDSASMLVTHSPTSNTSTSTV
ncbi:hypothetical protein K438DRAFT_948987 [Mycena galopus ATCC 62051]|nr:hypothetical protein K438DRAFT_453725 [Mycena galopus ATCC 62051]KAF8189591.1 hypothetical protein K438DRAFT_948987 [Mycena galopus ATCC 62051]